MFCMEIKKNYSINMAYNKKEIYPKDAETLT